MLKNIDKTKHFATLIMVSSNETYPDLLRLLKQRLLQLVRLDELYEERGELVRHTAGQNVALDGRRAPFASLHLEQIRDVQGKQIQNEVLGSLLFHVAPAHGLDENQKELVELWVLETIHDQIKINIKIKSRTLLGQRN